jgi:hypothetical protein
MKLSALFSSLLFVALPIAFTRNTFADAAAARTSSRVADPEEEAEHDAYLGMAGLQQAISDPKLLAQLMQDLQVSSL